MKIHTLDGMPFDKHTVTMLREQLIDYRNDALIRNDFGAAVTLSHIIAFLAFCVEELEE